MEGRYSLYLETRDRVYDFLFDKQVSILNGDSSTGKSEFVNSLQTSLWEIKQRGESMADFRSDFEWIVVLTPNDTSVDLIKGRIGIENLGKPGLVVSDENTLFFTKEWEIMKIMDILNIPDCYALLVTRSKRVIGSIPCSIKSVYEMVSGKEKGKTKVAFVNT